MSDKKLISLVEANQCLYNKRNKYYKMVDVKHNVWSQIAMEMGSTNEQCIRRWTTLRDRFSRECRKLLAPPESAARNDRLWPLFQRMQFVRQHIAPKPSRSGIKMTEITESSVSVSLSPTRSDPRTSPTNSDPPTSPTNSDLSTSSINSDSMPSSKNVPLQSLTVSVSLPSPPPADFSDSFSSPTPSTPTISRTRKKRNSDMDEAFLDAVEIFREYAKEQRAQRENQAVFGFTKMIVAKLSDMSAAQQTQTMLKLHQVLLEAEYEQ